MPVIHLDVHYHNPNWQEPTKEEWEIILKKLHNYGCRNLLIEGGDKLTNSLIKNKIFNKFYLYKSPKNLSKNFEYLKFSSQNILNQKYKTKINLNLNLRKDRITLYS